MFSTTSLNVRTSDGRNFVNLEEWFFTTKAGVRIVVPIGTTSDGASTPREIWSFIPPFGTYWMAAFLHDYLYRLSSYPKEFCDVVLLEAMECLGVDVIERDAIYEGVHEEGESSFDEDRKAQASPGTSA